MKKVIIVLPYDFTVKMQNQKNHEMILLEVVILGLNLSCR